MITLPNSSILKIALAYKDNLGFQEMLEFYMNSSPEEQRELMALLDSGNIEEALSMIENATGTELEPFNQGTDEFGNVLTECPRCKGTGEVSSDGNMHPNNPNQKRCPQCLGQGTISENSL